ncbi:class I adenylate-forming enzyme family protein [Actinoallomurus rhizosphaericola]|uniref:class I adenylate-forming enzyme family protein n=1 Tax=Actinoallomurus rhizosphaericola TaxID=2952536 RepID=UPI002091C130|nr:class I adenylate-forming enzyme family protein [Actinoallomurus rhizosphaericola]MCO5994305.1 acyl--CoA ligase [Actinoallomurus rhizosphaericola]
MDDFLRGAVDMTASGATNAALGQTMQDYQQLDLPPGTLVAIALPNGRDLLTHYFATVLSGLVPLLISPATSLSRVRELARHLNIGAYVAGERFAAKVGGGRTFAVGGRWLAWMPLDDDHPERYEPGDVVMLTSGTSGTFSACVNRFDALLRNARRHNAATGVRAGDTVLVILPLYYSYAIVAQALGALTAGARLVIGGPPFTTDGYRATITDHGIDISAVTPALARQLLAEDRPLPRRLRTLTVGGDQLPGAQVGELLARHDGELYLTYGLTEAGPRVSTLAAHQEPRPRWDSVGLPLPDVAVGLRNVRPDGIGELVVESDTVLRRKAGQFHHQPLLAPGRIATGDLFSIDDGYLFFAGRIRDFVVIRGEKVSLLSMRTAAQAVPGVVRARTAVINEGDDPIIELVVHVADPARTTPETMTRQLGRVLMRGERPHRVRVLAEDHAQFHK